MKTGRDCKGKEDRLPMPVFFPLESIFVLSSDISCLSLDGLIFRILCGCLLLQAVFTDSIIDHTVIFDFTVKVNLQRADTGQIIGIQIGQTAALPADKMFMQGNVGIEMNSIISDIDSSDLAHISEQHQIAINGAQTDVGIHAANLFVNNAGCRMI